LKSFIQSVSDKQAEYFVNEGKYFQGIITPETPQDGLIDAGVNWAVKPSDQETSWKDFAPNVFRSNVQIPFQISINIYESPDGWGWILVIDVWIDGLGPDAYGNDGSHWKYSHHEGPAVFTDIFDEWYISDEPY
jgi:hypothetical protein